MYKYVYDVSNQYVLIYIYICYKYLICISDVSIRYASDISVYYAYLA